jgi:hypothetical protein
MEFSFMFKSWSFEGVAFLVIASFIVLECSCLFWCTLFGAWVDLGIIHIVVTILTVISGSILLSSTDELIERIWEVKNFLSFSEGVLACSLLILVPFNYSFHHQLTSSNYLIWILSICISISVGWIGAFSEFTRDPRTILVAIIFSTTCCVLAAGYARQHVIINGHLWFLAGMFFIVHLAMEPLLLLISVVEVFLFVLGIS